jgi:hypothetical protein|tara:strand:+ start:62 stop:304 length:243 start_codon:yes stop_codon:yes gene_type:complete
MPKYIVKEGILDKFLGGIFGAIGKGKGKKLAKALIKDPELLQYAKEAEASREKMKKHIEKRKKVDPDFAKEYDRLAAQIK